MAAAAAKRLRPPERRRNAMNGWKFTWKNILNARGRYLILIAVSACLFAALLVAAGALTATLQREAELRLEYGATARVGLAKRNYSPSDPDSDLYTLLSEADYRALADDPYVTQVQIKSFLYCANMGDTALERNGSPSSLRNWHSFIIGYNMAEPNVFTNCTQADFKEGRCFSDGTECVVSDVTAALNALQVGDVLRFVHMPTGAALEMTVVGIVSSAKMESRYADSPAQEAYIFTDMSGPAAAFGKLHRQSINFNNTGVEPFSDGYDVVVSLDSPEHFSDYQAKMLDKTIVIDGQEYRYTVDYYTGGYWELFHTLQPIAQRSLLIELLVAVLFAALTLTAAVINLRARKQQFGILLSMGMPRHEILLSYCLEQVLVFLASVLLGALLGLLAAPALGISIPAKAFGAVWYCFGILAVALVVMVCTILRFRPIKLLRN